MKKLVYVITVIIISLGLNGCATTGAFYNSKNKELTLMNNDKEMIIPNIKILKDKVDLSIDRTRGSFVITKYQGKSSSCQNITIYEYLPVGFNAWYNSDVKEDLESKFKGNIEKNNDFYIANFGYKLVIGINGSNAGMGVDSKTFIEMSPGCWNSIK